MTALLLFGYLVIWKLAGWKTCACDLAEERGFARFAPILLNLLIMGTCLLSLLNFEASSL
jgi:hypothetical protein